MILHNAEKADLLSIRALRKPLKALADDSIVESEDHDILYSENNILGVRKQNSSENNENTDLVFDYSAVYNAFTFLVTSLNINYEKEFILSSKSNSWAAFIAGYGSASGFDSSYEEFSNSNKTITNDLEYNPAVAFVNGYDYNDNLRFYVLVIANDGLLTSIHTLGKWSLSNTMLKELQVSDDKSSLLTDYLKESSDSFERRLNGFKENIDFLKLTSLSRDEFIGCCLDIYQVNRSTQTLRNDSSALSRFKNIEDSVTKAFKNKELFTLKSCIDFIGWRNAYRLRTNTISREIMEELFQERNAFKNLLSRVQNNENKSQYLQEQAGIYLRLKHDGF